MCSGVVAWALRRDRARALQPIAAESAEGRALLGPAFARALEELHAWSADGGLQTGPAAVAALLERLPRWRLVGVALRLPIVRTLARLGYRWVARRRGWFGPPRCPLPSRSVPLPEDAKSRR